MTENFISISILLNQVFYTFQFSTTETTLRLVTMTKSEMILHQQDILLLRLILKICMQQVILMTQECMLQVAKLTKSWHKFQSAKLVLILQSPTLLLALNILVIGLGLVMFTYKIYLKVIMKFLFNMRGQMIQQLDQISQLKIIQYVSMHLRQLNFQIIMVNNHYQHSMIFHFGQVYLLQEKLHNNQRYQHLILKPQQMQKQRQP